MNGFQPPRRPDTRGEELVEESFQDIGKAARGVWDFFTSPDTGEFVRKVDERHGTNFAELHAKIKAGPVAELAGETRHEGCVHNPPCPGPRCTVYSEPERIAQVSSRAVPTRIVGAREVVIELHDDECAFCEGKQVIAKRGETRTPIACPTCRKDPSKKNPKRLSR